MKTSRYLRRENPVPLKLQSRDHEILQHMATHWYLTSDHIQQLAFTGSGLRSAQNRLRKLFDHHYLHRLFIPYVVFEGKPSHPLANRPLYALSKKGAEIVARDTQRTLKEVPYCNRENLQSFGHMEHNLVATDLMVAMQAACQDRSDLDMVSVVRDPELFRALHHRPSQWIGRTSVLSDGAFALAPSGQKQPWWFHIEIVRAGIKGGNKTLLKRLRTYVELHHEGFFRDIFGHDQLRAVLICTTSEERAENFRQLAEQLPHGRNLFWFTSYKKEKDEGLSVSRFTPDMILESIWTDWEGKPQSLDTGH